MSTSSSFSTDKRTAGILLHISSLPNKFPIGNLGESAHKFVKQLASAGQTWWQLLPTNPIGAGYSPYSSICGVAGEALLICPQELVKDGLLTKSDLRQSKATNPRKVNYPAAAQFIYPLLRKAFSNFSVTSREFVNFCREEYSWLHDFAMFQSLAAYYKTNAWCQWPQELRQRKPAALKAAEDQFADEINFYKFVQFCFFKQWRQLRKVADSLGVGLVGDIPIFASYDSVDVWANQDQFWVNPDGSQQFVAGVPPDYFNKDGQRWGNALYKWNVMKKDGFSWWISRLKLLTKQFALVRIDHFIGFYRYWEIPVTAPSAKTGTWRLVPGDEFFAAVKHALGSLPFIAEDLGLVTPEVTALREKYQLPGMKILHFAFANDGGKSAHLPCNYTPDFVAYTGTHDNDTSFGWYNTAKKESRKKNPSFDLSLIDGYFVGDTKQIHWQMIADVFKSVANTAIVPLQDVLGLDSKARMNIPGTTKNNWIWRYAESDLKKADLEKLAKLTRATGRSANQLRIRAK